MAKLLPNIKARFTDANGLPLAGGKVFSYIANTATPLATYTDASAATPNTNPVILNANGEANIWLSNAYYKIIVTDANDQTIYTVDNVSMVEDVVAAAETAKVQAQAAQAAAEAAQAAAETAEANAETAQGLAETAAATATTKASDALSSAVNAGIAQGIAQDAREEANDWANAAGVYAAQALTQAGIATTQAGIATTKAGEASTSAAAAAAAQTAAETAKTAAELAETNAETAETNAETAQGLAETAATTATAQAGIATTQAGIATTKASEAAASASTAATDAATATTQAGIATTQAGIATTKAGEAATSATNAATSEANAAAAVATHSADTTSVHGIADTSKLLTTDGAQVVTAKDIDGGTASNTSRLTLPKNTKANLDALTRKEATLLYATDTKKAYVDDGSTLVAVGSGSGSGGVNFIVDGDAESGTAIGTSYANGSAVPTTGTGGSPTATWTVSSSSPLAGVNSFVFTPGGLGNGRNIPFTISREAYGKVLEIKFSYEIGTYTSYTDGDLTAYIKAPSGAIVQPVGFKIVKASGPQTFKATFQTETSGSSYYLLIHQATSATAYGSVKIDSISVGPQSTVNATLVTDWQSYTPTITNLGAGSTSAASGKYRRVGDSAEVMVTFTKDATPGSGSNPVRISLPSGLTIDSAKTPDSVWKNTVGSGSYTTTSGNFVSTDVYVDLGNFTTGVQLIKTGSATAVYGSDVLASSVFLATFKVPILGWGSSTVASSESDGRVVAFRATGNATGTIANSYASGTALTWPTLAYDSAGGYNGTTTYTVAAPGYYRVFGNFGITNTGTQSYAGVSLYVNGVQYADQTQYQASSNTLICGTYAWGINLKAGDALTLRATSNGTSPSLTGGSLSNSFNIERLSGSSTIVAGETVAAKAFKTSGAHTSTGNWQTVASYTTKQFDTHGCLDLTTGKFTCPTAGKFLVCATVSFITNTSGVRQIRIVKNADYSGGYGAASLVGASAIDQIMSTSSVISCLAGDTLMVDSFQTSGGNLNYGIYGDTCTAISVVRVGN